MTNIVYPCMTSCTTFDRIVFFHITYRCEASVLFSSKFNVVHMFIISVEILFNVVVYVNEGQVADPYVYFLKDN
jgi:hypothetical protein